MAYYCDDENGPKLCVRHRLGPRWFLFLSFHALLIVFRTDVLLKGPEWLMEVGEDEKGPKRLGEGFFFFFRVL